MIIGAANDHGHGSSQGTSGAHTAPHENPGSYAASHLSGRGAAHVDAASDAWGLGGWLLGLAAPVNAAMEKERGIEQAAAAGSQRAYLG